MEIQIIFANKIAYKVGKIIIKKIRMIIILIILIIKQKKHYFNLTHL